jgi:hypothetical protein
MKGIRPFILLLTVCLLVSFVPAQEVTPSSIPTGSASNGYGPYAYRDSPQALFIYKELCGEYGSPLSGTLTCLWNDNLDSWQMFASGSPTATAVGRLQNSFTSLTAQTAVTSVTTAQTMGSFPALPAGYHNVAGRTLRVCEEGVYTSSTNTPTVTFSVAYGGITPVSITSAALSGTASTNAPWHACFEMTAVSTGATGTLEAHGQLDLNIAANTPAAAIARYLDTNTAVSSAINLTSANTIALNVAASASLTSVTLRHATLEVLGD